MENFNFEDYRQAWETGDHWELKREFIERYQNDYPVDRLLCLAQAYSNIELLHCSYPDPVMREIHELSKPLKACKMFRDRIGKNSSVVTNETKFTKAVKACDQDFVKPKKLISFCSASDSIDNTQSKKNTGKSKSSEQHSDQPKKCIKLALDCDAEDCSQSDKKGEMQVSESSGKQTTSTDVHTSGITLSQDLKNASQAALSINEEILKNIDKIAQALSINEETLKSVWKISQELRNRLLTKCIIPTIPLIYIASQKSKIKVFFDLKRTKIDINEINRMQKSGRPENDLYDCDFYVEDFLISSIKRRDKKSAKLNAASEGLNFLRDPSNLTVKLSGMLESQGIKMKELLKNVSKETNFTAKKSNIVSEEKQNVSIDTNLYENNESFEAETDTFFVERKGQKQYLLLGVAGSETQQNNSAEQKCSIPDKNVRLIYNLKDRLHLNPKSCPSKALRIAAEQLGIPNSLSFIPLKDPNLPTAKNASIRSCKCYIKNILISIGKGNTKRKAKSEAAQLAVNKLTCMNRFIFKDQNQFNARAIERLMDDDKKIKPVPLHNPFISSNTLSTAINKVLLNNSMQKNFAIYDTSSKSESSKTPGSLLFNSASFCKRKITYDEANFETSSRIDVILDGEIVGSGSASTRENAKRVAAFNALSNLRKIVYTIKVKDEHTERFVIPRDQMIASKISSGYVAKMSAISETNIGCKMLKGMGWTGGSIGKNGILEPIQAEGNRFGQGLGFVKEGSHVTTFRRNIHSLLQDFLKSNSISDLIFSKEFSKEERKEIHWIAKKYNLHTGSEGNDSARHIIVRNKFTFPQLMDILIKAGGSTTKYELVDLSKES